MHEVYARDWAASGFAACLAIRAAGNKPLFWVRPDYEALEYGALHAQGLAELGGAAGNLFLVRDRQCHRSAGRRQRHSRLRPVGALLLEISGMPRALDLVASRKLNFAANLSGVTAILLREGAEAMPSAAQTRWQVSAAPSSGNDDWGLPSFQRRTDPQPPWPHRTSGGMTWSPEDGIFREPAHERTRQ